MTNKEILLVRKWLITLLSSGDDSFMDLFNKTKLESQLTILKAERKAEILSAKSMLSSEEAEL